MIGFNTDMQNQLLQLSKILRLNDELYSLMERVSSIGMQNYYFGAGCIAQTVWNYQSGVDLSNGISDIDFVYYDGSDLSSQAENEVKKRLSDVIPPCKVEIDINNQARVHLWYKEHYGYDIKPYSSLESAINTWPTTATAVGVRLDNAEIKVYAPFGLNDLFGMIVRANKAQITEEIYMKKVHKWSAIWPSLVIVPW
jgi:hypothetical protein